MPGVEHCKADDHQEGQCNFVSRQFLGVAIIAIIISYCSKMADAAALGHEPAGERRFHYQFRSGGTSYDLSVPLRFPYRGEVRELALRLIRGHKLPCYLEEELTQQLKGFIREQSLATSDACSEVVMDRSLKSEKVAKQSKLLQVLN